MSMNASKFTTLRTLLFSSLLLAGCSATQKASDGTARKSKNPKFLDDITLAGNNTNRISIRDNRSSNDAQYDPANANTLQVKYASLMKVVPQAIRNFSLYSFIDDWYGVPYRFGGIDKGGIDCSAFVQRLYENVFRTSLVRTAFEQFNLCRMVWDTTDLKEGDLVFFKIHSRRISHVGIYLMNNFFVHASVSQGVMISSLNDSYWQRFFAGAGQIPKGN
ncbi:C40 family peptidase [Chitinophagaceae bacterium MMS25-I14]